MYMLRKQLYINEEQERTLKRRSKDLGLSEAELVRRALDAVLRGDGNALARPSGGDAIQAFIDEAERIAGTVTLWSPLNRDDLYAERVDRRTQQ